MVSHERRQLTVSAYYNEHDPKAAAWLRVLIAEGLIADGEVDERSIVDVRPGDLAGFRQCHFFAGIGGWSLALRLAGWPDDRPVWTGSCPCQPFSSAGKGHGTADERHLWPEFARLIGECRPPVVFGEQVASKAGRQWLAAVFADLEGLAYRRAGADLCAAGVGAPHIRQRLWWVADDWLADGAGTRRRSERPHVNAADGARAVRAGQAESRRCGAVGLLVLPSGERREGLGLRLLAGGPQPAGVEAGRGGEAGLLADHLLTGRPEGGTVAGTGSAAGVRGAGELGNLGNAEQQRRQGWHEHTDESAGGALPTGNTGFWSACDWLPCRDGKARPVEPGTQPMVDGLSRAVGRLRDHERAALAEVAGYAQSQGHEGEGVRVVLDAVRSQALYEWSTRGLRDVCAPEVLLAFLRNIAEACEPSSDERRRRQKAGDAVHERAVRFVRGLKGLDDSPLRRGPEEQRTGEPSDALSALSLVLARTAEAYRGDALTAYAATGRVGRLRGYGNAIVPQVAAEFVGAYLDIRRGVTA